MSSCKHLHWLELLGRKHDWALLDPDRLKSIESLLPDPARQTPILMVFLGKSRKASVIQTVFSQNDLNKTDSHGIANLFIDHSTEDSDSPWLVADGTLNASPMNHSGAYSTCHDNRRLFINYGEAEAGNDRAMVVAHLHANLLIPLAHVVCLFAEDFGGNKACCGYIGQWLSLRKQASSQRLMAAPDLIVVTEDPSTIDMFIQLECETEFGNVFETLTVVTVDVCAPPNLTAQKLHRILQETAKISEQTRSENHLRLTACHMRRIFHHGVQIFAVSPSQGLDILSSSDHPAARLMIPASTHLKAFLRQSQSLDLEQNMVIELLASALLKQGYPEFLHRFAPHVIYRHFFAAIVSSLSIAALEDPPFHESIREEFERLFSMLTSKRTAVMIRARYLKRYWRQLRNLHSTTTCWRCMVRAPEHMLHMGHGLCDPCVLESGVTAKSVHTYRIQSCPVCGHRQQATISVKPWTVEPNVLAIDGGGIKGIVALVLLKKLTAALGSNTDEYFHYSAGTSAGGLVVLDYIVGAATIESSIERFECLARRIFPVKSYGRFSLLWKLFDWLKWFLTDNKYDSSVLEDVVQEVFGTRERLFGDRAHRERSRIGIMATTASSSHLRIFTNYNGEARSEQGNAYAILRSEKATEEPFLWEVARCTTAAPGFFRPKQLKFFGSLQDGGMRANNPSAVARVELRYIWPQTSKPHVLVSIGNGYSRQDLADTGTDRGLLRDGFISRVLRGFMSSPSVDGDSGWLNLLDNLSAEERTRHFRLSLPFDGDPPALDDASSIPRLEAQAMAYKEDYSELVRRLWASRFFVEFQSDPCYSFGEYHCRIAIHFHGDDIRPLLRIIREKYPHPQLKQGNRILSRLYQHDHICQTCGHLQLAANFRVRSLDESISVKLVFASAVAAPINGDGHSAAWFMERQMLYGSLRRWQGGQMCCAQRLPTSKQQTSRASKKRKVAAL